MSLRTNPQSSQPEDYKSDLSKFSHDVSTLVFKKLSSLISFGIGVFSPSVCKFISVRDYENHDSGILAWVTSFTGEDPLGIIELNEFVFGANPR